MSKSSSQIVFHSVNKSGSKALVNSFRKIDRSCVEIVKDLADLESKLRVLSRQPRLYMGHNLYQGERFMDVMMMTQLRNPVARIVSIWYWWEMKRKAGMLSNETTRSFEEFILNDRELFRSSMVAQFAVPFNLNPQSRNLLIRSLDLESALDLAIGRLESDFDLITYAEHFEESLVLVSRFLGMDLYPAWFTDNRNVERPLLATFPRELLASIRSKLWYDYDLYYHFEPKFQEKIQAFKTSPKFLNYKKRMENQYKETIPNFLV